MKIALIGIRGIPVVYSGYETFSEVISSELVKKGHEVTVYCRNKYVDRRKKVHKGVNLVILPTIASKNFDTIFHSFISTIHACFQGYDAVLYLSVGNSIFSVFPRLFGMKTIVNVDGMDWKRKKWGWFARKFLNYSEYLATILPNAIVTDSHFIKKYYSSQYKKQSFYIPYGGFTGCNNDAHTLNKYGLFRNGYFVWNGRMVPDNHIDDLVRALKTVETELKCVILGGDLYKSEYVKYLHDLAAKDSRFLFPGFVSHDEAEALVGNSFAYVETKRSGGTHPSLVEAMSVGALIICDDCPANREVLGDSALFYDQKKADKDLALKIIDILKPASKKRIALLKEKAIRRAQDKYGWEKITVAYEKLLSR